MSENPLRDLIEFLDTLPPGARLRYAHLSVLILPWLVEVNPYPIFAQETKARGL